MNKTHLYVLWTNADPVTAEKMVFMYTINSLIHSWWEKVTLIIWGAPAKLVSENADIQEKMYPSFPWLKTLLRNPKIIFSPGKECGLDSGS